MTFKSWIFLFILAVCTQDLAAQVRLPRLIRDSMILQRDQKIKLWGWASAREKVNIRFNRKVYKTTADEAGNWMVNLPPTKAGGPFEMEISATNKITLREILFGDVWYCSGQSNMVHQMNIHDVTYAKDIAEANFPQIRQFWIPTVTNLTGPQADISTGYWRAAVGDEVRPFSAVAYFFAKKIHEKYAVPVGIINASVGGTPIEAWISEEGFNQFPGLTSRIEKNKDTAYVNDLNRKSASNLKRTTPVDAGLGQKKWFEADYTPKGWRTINVPGYWEDQGLNNLNGVVWYRREIQLPASMAGQAARVFLGRIVDADDLYINGKKVGTTGYQYPQRRYSVPKDVLKAGKNIFIVRVTNTSGKGGFVPDKPYYIFSGADTVDLEGSWQYKVGGVFPPTGGGPGGGINAQNQPAALYNAMVAPGINYAIKGFCWYQGEANTGRADEYEKLLPALIRDWRSNWNLGMLPFLFVQLPGFMDYNYLPAESQWAALREAQLKSLSVPNTEMVVAIDLGEWNDIHPDNKKDVGERLALAAFKSAYKEDIVASGPLFKSATVKGAQIVAEFTSTGGGLTTNDGEPLSEFAIAGANKKFAWAKAIIEGNTVVISSDEVPTPMYIRYAWADNPVNPNLYNKEGLPASPFRTDK
ncbi:MAG: sialate O-acetylesterase [Bacteroidota bacterium]